MPFIPQGTPGVLDPRNPTLLPQFDVPTVGKNGTVGLSSPAQFLSDNPRVDATANATIGGTRTNADTVVLTITGGTLPAGAIALTYTVVTADTTTTIAEGLADLINSSAACQAAGIYAEMAGTSFAAVLVVHAPGPVGNFMTLSSSVTGSATETVVLGQGSTPITNASNDITLGGTETDGDIVSLTFTNAGVAGFPVTVTHTAAASESINSIATAMRAAVNANTTLIAAGLVATGGTNHVTIGQPGTIANSTVITGSVSGAATETITFNPLLGAMTGGAGVVGGALTGGSGPIIPLNNFNWSAGGSTMSFFYGSPRNVGYDQITAMVAQGMPIG